MEARFINGRSRVCVYPTAGALLTAVFAFGVPQTSWAAGPTITLATAGDTSVQSGQPISNTAADINRDGNLDAIVLVNRGSGSDVVGVMLGDGTGQLGSMASYATGDVANFGGQVTTGDLNGDGFADVVNTNYDDSTISVFLNDGTGQLGTRTVYNTASSPTSVGLAEFAGDGKLDAVVTVMDSGTASASVLVGNGSGAFGTTLTTSTGAGTAPLSQAIADFDHDGNLDVATGNSGASGASIMLGDGAGGFPVKTQYPFIFLDNLAGIAAADVTGDGFADLAATSQISYSWVGVAVNNGNGTFNGWSLATVPANSIPVATADFNGDGFSDVASGLKLGAGPYYDNVALLTSEGDGNFEPAVAHTTDVAGSVYGLTTGDFNSDGKPDLLASGSSSIVSILLNTTTYLAPTVTSVSPVTGSVAGGTTVTITGANLTSATSVTFDGIEAASRRAISAQQIQVVTPAHAGGQVPVVITTPGGTASTTYRYVSGRSRPGRPTNLTIAGTPLSKRYLINWNQPTGVSESRPVTKYRVTIRPVGGRQNIVKPLPGSARSTAVTRQQLLRLAPRARGDVRTRRYVVRVQAGNSAGFGAAARTVLRLLA